MGRGAGGGAGWRGAGGFANAHDQRVFAQRVGTTGRLQAMGFNGRQGWSGKYYELYVEGNKGSTTFTFNSAQEGNKMISQLLKNGFSYFKGYEGTFNG